AIVHPTMPKIERKKTIAEIDIATSDPTDKSNPPLITTSACPNETSAKAGVRRTSRATSGRGRPQYARGCRLHRDLRARRPRPQDGPFRHALGKQAERPSVEQRRPGATGEAGERRGGLPSEQRIDQERRDQRPMHDEAGIAFDASRIVAIIVD